MPYTAEISRANPSSMIFLIDQSGSMADPFGGEEQKSKADILAMNINHNLQNLVIRCAKAEGVRDYYHVGVIGYGAQVGPAFSGALAGRELVPLSEVANNPARIEERPRKVPDGAGGLVEEKVRFPIWFEPVARGATPMCEALTRASSLVDGWLDEHPDCFPPIVMNITDGEATDHGGDVTKLLDAAESVKQLASSDGNVLLFNAHISAGAPTPIEFPDSEERLPNEYARVLFRMSSLLPPHLRSAAEEEEFSVSPASRGFLFNADQVAIIKFLDIGTRPSSLR